MNRYGHASQALAALVVAVVLSPLLGCGGSSSKEVMDTTNPADAIVAAQAAEWESARAQAEAIAAGMSRAEMERLVIGAGWSFGTPADGHYAAGRIPSITIGETGYVIPAQFLCDGPNGVGNSNTGVTRFATGISVAASWDKDLATAYGAAIGNEWQQKGCTHGLAPGMNIIRLPYGGRSAEYYSEDPVLAGAIAVHEAQGIQSQHVIATAKHYAANNQETERSGGNSSVSERALREIYLPAFEDSVKIGGVGALMCSYNRINGTYACANDHVQNEIARGEWGFTGLIMSDWGANHGSSTTTAPQFALGGLDMDMPGGTWSAANLAAVSDAYMRTMCVRILAAMIKVGLIDESGATTNYIATPVADVSSDAHKEVAGQISAAGTVLLKNVNGALPLDPFDAGLRIVVIGGAADASAHNFIGGSGMVSASETVVTPLAGIQAATEGTVTYYEGSSGTGALTTLTPHTTSGGAVSGWNVTYATAAGQTLAYTAAGDVAFPVPTSVGSLPNQTCNVSPWGTFCSGGSAYLNGTSVSLVSGSVSWVADYTGYVTIATPGTYEFRLQGNGAATLYVDDAAVGSLESTFLTEDRSFLAAITTAGEHRVELRYSTESLTWFNSPSIALSWNSSGNAMDAAVAAAAEADVAIVVLSDNEAEGGDHSAYLPGSQNLLVERVTAVAQKTIVVLSTGSGLVLPWADQVDAIVENWYGGQRQGSAIAAVLFGDVNPSGRAVVTFPASMAQWYAQQHSQFPGVATSVGDGYHTVSYDEGIFPGYRWFDQNEFTPLFPFGHGLSYTTFAYSDLKVSAPEGDGSAVAVTVRITNSGSRSGAEVAQLYLGFPDYAGEPPRQLKGFEKVTLDPGASATVKFYLNARSFSYWDESGGDWKKPVGVFPLYVGASSRDIRVTGSYAVK